MALGELRIRLLGGLDVEGVAPTELGSRKARTLVKVLALGRGAPVSADRVVEALWPDDNVPAKPVEQVGVLVSRLRGVLGSDRLVRNDAGWSLAVDWLDVAELDERVEEAASRLVAGNPAAARVAARAALTLVRGELLADEPDAVWAEAYRAAVAREVARARLVGAEAALASGDPGDAAAVAEGALDHDPYDEAALRVLMQAHAAAGRPASALAAYARVRARLADDLGVDPARETEDLHTAILLAEPPPDAPSDTAESPLVGRRPQLDALDVLLRRVAAGSAALAVVEGEAGIGKTTLVNAWSASAAAGALVLTGRCDELGRDLPLQPLLDGLDAHLRTLDEDAVDAVLADAQPILGPLRVRGGAEATGTGPTTVRDPVAGQALLFASLLGAIERAAGDRPAVVIAEDVHLAGASTIEWLRFAVRRAQRLLIVATRRPEGPPVGAAELVPVGPLDLASVAELVGDARAAELHERSGGHPLFLHELATAAPGELPASVRDAVAARVVGLDDAAHTLRVAAVLGPEVDVDLLAGVLSIPVATLLEHVDAGLRALLLAEVGSSLAFRHELLREALVAGTTAARRAYVHREAARVLHGRPAHDPLEVAWHARSGGDVEMAASALVDAASMAAGRYDATLAEELLTNAIALHDSIAARLARARLRIAVWALDGAREDVTEALELGAGAAGLEVAAWVAYYERDYERALRYADEAVAQSADDGLRTSCLAMSGRVLHASGDVAGGELRLEAAVRAAPAAVQGLAQTWLGSLRTHQGRLDEGLALIDRALVERRRLAHPFALHHAEMFRALALGQSGRVVEALRAVEAMAATAAAAGQQGERFLIASHNVQSWLLRAIGLLDAGDEFTERSLSSPMARDAGTRMTEPSVAALLDRFESRLLARDVDGAAEAEIAAAGVHTSTGTMFWRLRIRYDIQRARLALARDDPSAALGLVSAAHDAAVAQQSPRYVGMAAAVAARAHVGLGDTAAVDQDELAKTIALLDGCGALEAWWVTAEVAAALDRAGIDADRWWRDADRRAGALVGQAGAHSESLRRHVAMTFAALGRRS
jgi:DNA-binding SARP family transcriptional activator